MCAHILKSALVPFTAHIGGHDCDLGNFYSSGKEIFLTEACEYKRNLLKIPATHAVVLNVDFDHTECYQNFDDLTGCFRTFAQKAQVAFVCADDPRCKGFGDFVTFGVDNPASNYRAVDLRADKERYSFVVEEYGKRVCAIKLKAIGRCHVYNALAAFAVMRSFGFDTQCIRRGLENFSAIKRRFERIGKYKGADIVCDYAHHPKEILSTLSTAEKISKGNLYVVFQPHTYSRTKS
jgi:UDP-N-acetylmuramate--alanine ligase